MLLEIFRHQIEPCNGETTAYWAVSAQVLPTLSLSLEPHLEYHVILGSKKLKKKMVKWSDCNRQLAMC